MRLLNLLVTGSILGLAANAHAITFLKEDTQEAVILYMQGENVNAAYCTKVTESMLNQTPNVPVTPDCKPVTPEGVSRADIDAKLPKMKEDGLKNIDTLSEGMDKVAGVAGEDTKNQMHSMMSGLYDRQREEIRAQTTDSFLHDLVVQAKTPNLQKTEKVEDLNDLKTLFVELTTK